MSAIEDLNRELSRLPGIGQKTAVRLTYHLLKRPRSDLHRLADSLRTLADTVAPCSRCGNMTDTAVCSICSDPRRDTSVVCVVEEAYDIDAIERAGQFRGLYHVLGGHLSPLDGVGPEDLALEGLRNRVENGVAEVIVATNPSMEGEATATYIRGMLDAGRTRVSRIALGLPVGGDLQYADGVTIAQALAARREMPL